MMETHTTRPAESAVPARDGADVQRHLPLRALAAGGVVTRSGVVMSAREVAVLESIWRGWPRARTARRVGVSVETVTRDRRRLSDRLGLRPERLAVLWDRSVRAELGVGSGRAAR